MNSQVIFLKSWLITQYWLTVLINYTMNNLKDFKVITMQRIYKIIYNL